MYLILRHAYFKKLLSSELMIVTGVRLLFLSGGFVYLWLLCGINIVNYFFDNAATPYLRIILLIAAVVGCAIYSLTNASNNDFVPKRIICGTHHYDTVINFDFWIGFLTMWLVAYTAESMFDVMVDMIMCYGFYMAILILIPMMQHKSIGFSMLLTGTYVRCSRRDMVLDFVRARNWWNDTPRAFKYKLWKVLPAWKWNLNTPLETVNDKEALKELYDWLSMDDHDPLWLTVMALNDSVNAKSLAQYKRLKKQQQQPVEHIVDLPDLSSPFSP